MEEKDQLTLCSKLWVIDREKKTEARLNILWVPYIATEKVLHETQQFSKVGKTFSLAAINDQKVKIEEVHTVLKSLRCLSKLPVVFKRKVNATGKPENSFTFNRFMATLQ